MRLPAARRLYSTQTSAESKSRPPKLAQPYAQPYTLYLHTPTPYTPYILPTPYTFPIRISIPVCIPTYDINETARDPYLSSIYTHYVALFRMKISIPSQTNIFRSTLTLVYLLFVPPPSPQTPYAPGPGLARSSFRAYAAKFFMYLVRWYAVM